MDTDGRAAPRRAAPTHPSSIHRAAPSSAACHHCHCPQDLPRHIVARNSAAGAAVPGDDGGKLDPLERWGREAAVGSVGFPASAGVGSRVPRAGSFSRHPMAMMMHQTSPLQCGGCGDGPQAGHHRRDAGLRPALVSVEPGCAHARARTCVLARTRTHRARAHACTRKAHALA